MNKNKFKVIGTDKREEGEYLILLSLPEPTDPKFDDLPSEQLQPGEEIYMTFERVKKEMEKPFNEK